MTILFNCSLPVSVCLSVCVSSSQWLSPLFNPSRPNRHPPQQLHSRLTLTPGNRTWPPSDWPFINASHLTQHSSISWCSALVFRRLEVLRSWLWLVWSSLELFSFDWISFVCFILSDREVQRQWIKSTSNWRTRKESEGDWEVKTRSEHLSSFVIFWWTKKLLSCSSHSFHSFSGS